MKRIVLTGMALLTLTGCAWAEEKCVEENARVQAAVIQAQNELVQTVVLQGQIALLKDQLKALQDEKTKASNPKAESAAEPAPDTAPNNAPAQ